MTGGGYSLADNPAVPSSEEPGGRRLWVKLVVVAVAVVVMVAAGLASGVSLKPKGPPDRADLVVLDWWWNALPTPTLFEDEEWRQAVCDGAEGQASQVIAAELTRERDGWPPKDWKVTLVSLPRTQVTTRGKNHATVRFDSTTEIRPAGSNGWESWRGTDQTWTFTLTHARTWRGRRWCIDHIARTYRPGWDPADQQASVDGGQGSVGDGASGDLSTGDTGAQGEDVRVGVTLRVDRARSSG